MKILMEAPFSALCAVDALTDGGFCLAHLFVENEAYRNHYLRMRRAGSVVFLDNSTWEKEQPMDPVAYGRLALNLKPTVVVYPDFWMDREKTRVACKVFNGLYRKAFDEAHIEVMVVPQCRMDEDWEDVYHAFVEEFEPDCVGIPTCPVEEKTLKGLERAALDRWGRCTMTLTVGYWRRDLAHHLLGATHPNFIPSYLDLPSRNWSFDTSKLLKHAVVGKNWFLEPDPNLPKKDMHTPLSLDALDKLAESLGTFRERCGG